MPSTLNEIADDIKTLSIKPLLVVIQIGDRKDSTIYVIGLPICHDCAKGLIQAGISRVVTPEQEIPENWQESISSSISMFKEAGVIWDWIKL